MPHSPSLKPFRVAVLTGISLSPVHHLTRAENAAKASALVAQSAPKGARIVEVAEVQPASAPDRVAVS